MEGIVRQGQARLSAAGRATAAGREGARIFASDRDRYDSPGSFRSDGEQSSRRSGPNTVP